MTDDVSYTIEEVARMLKVSKDTIRRMIKARKIEVFHVGRRIRIRKEVVDRIMGNQ